MDLELEIVGEVSEVLPGEALPPAPLKPLQHLRDSHHLAARLLAQGEPVWRVAMQTPYTAGRLSVMATRDPTFRELVAHYRRDNALVARDNMELCAQIGTDLAQIAHERLVQNGEAYDMPYEALMDATKLFMDRGGNAPITRSMAKNVNFTVGIAERMDAAKRRKLESVE